MATSVAEAATAPCLITWGEDAEEAAGSAEGEAEWRRAQFKREVAKVDNANNAKCKSEKLLC